MTKHKQVEILIDKDFSIMVDEGLEDIIKNFFHWGIPTCLSCINTHDSIWLEFEEINDCRALMLMALCNNTQVNGGGYVRQTLYQFLQEQGFFSLSFDEGSMLDPNNIDEVGDNYIIGNGQLNISVSLTFPSNQLETFKKLFFEVFPPSSE